MASISSSEALKDERRGAEGLGFEREGVREGMLGFKGSRVWKKPSESVEEPSSTLAKDDR